MVCMGNICRSPLAEGIFKRLIIDRDLEAMVSVDSAGTHFYHVGCEPDERSVLVAKTHGLDISTQRARQLHPSDAETFDFIVVMDKRNLRDALAILKASGLPDDELKSKVSLLLSYARVPLLETEVPDPYYGGADGFEQVFQLVQQGCDGLLNTVLEQEDLVSIGKC
jgi:protein-tyrosine phosphatase